MSRKKPKKEKIIKQDVNGGVAMVAQLEIPPVNTEPLSVKPCFAVGEEIFDSEEEAFKYLSGKAKKAKVQEVINEWKEQCKIRGDMRIDAVSPGLVDFLSSRIEL